MDKNLDSRPKAPWWLVLLQMAPLLLPLVVEMVTRVQGAGSMPVQSPTQAAIIPDPLDVSHLNDTTNR